jgi:hypothetical protein
MFGTLPLTNHCDLGFPVKRLCITSAEKGATTHFHFALCVRIVILNGA